MQSSNHRHHHHHHHRNAGRRGGSGSGSKSLDPPMMLQQGQVLFRLLCHVDAAGGVIGSSGAIVKQMERDTGARILVEDSVPNCHERVINVIGHSTIDRKIALEDEGEETEEVSQAQEGLMRAFDRLLKVEGSGEGVIGCRLLAGSGQVGAVMGKGGKIVDRIRKESGAKIRVLPKDQLPDCASPEEDLIQIMGRMMAAKQALSAISRRLQDRTPTVQADSSSYGSSPDPHTEFLSHHSSPSLPGYAGSHSSVGHSLSADVDKNLKLGQDNGRKEVLFRLLCYSCTAGGIIGKAAAIVKALERESGASIKFAAAVAGSKERVASIYAMEDPEPLYSPAQVAIMHVFARSVEVGINQGLISGETVSARLLVASDHIHCLLDEGRTIAPDIITVSGVLIQLLDGDLLPNCAAENDKVVQINGEYENVKSALFQITGRLRDNLFSSTVSDGAGGRHYSFAAFPDVSPYGRGKTNSCGLNHSSGLSPIDQMDHLGFLRKLARPHSPSLQLPQMMDRGNIAAIEDGAGGLTTFVSGLECERISPALVVNETVEVVVPTQNFGSVYGENRSNLARLKEISGATISVQEPCPGKHEGKVVISGTADQILVAQSLLQAFIFNHP